MVTPPKGHFRVSAQLSTGAVGAPRKVWVPVKLQALVYDILPSRRKVPESGDRSVGTNKTVEAIIIVQELCESRGGRPGLSVLTSLLVSVDVKLY